MRDAKHRIFLRKSGKSPKEAVLTQRDKALICSLHGLGLFLPVTLLIFRPLEKISYTNPKTPRLRGKCGKSETERKLLCNIPVVH